MSTPLASPSVDVLAIVGVKNGLHFFVFFGSGWKDHGLKIVNLRGKEPRYPFG